MATQQELRSGIDRTTRTKLAYQKALIERQKAQAKIPQSELINQYKQEQAKIQTAELDKEISSLQERINAIRQRAIETNQGRLDKRDKERLNELEAEIGGLNNAKSLARTGEYTLGSVLSYAYSKGKATLQKKEIKKQVQGVEAQIKEGIISSYASIPKDLQKYFKETVTTTSLPTQQAVSRQSVVKDSSFVGPTLPAGWTPPTQQKSIFKTVGTTVSQFGAGIGNIIRGQSFDTPVRTNIGTDIYPTGTPKYTETPKGYTAVSDISGVTYVPTRNFERGINIPEENIKAYEIKPSYSGEVKSEGLVKPTVKRISKATEDVLNVVGKVGEFPSIYSKEGSLLGYTIAQKTKYKEPETIGQSAQVLTETITKTGELANKLTEDLFFKTGIETEYTVPEKYVHQYQKATLSNIPTVEGNILVAPTNIFIPENKEKNIAGVYKDIVMFGQKATIETAPWIFAPELMVTATTLSSSEKLKNVNEKANKILEQQYIDYSKIIPTEGNRLLTKEEFIKEYKSDTINQLKNQAILEGGMALGFGAFGFGSKVVRKVTKPIVETRTYKPIEFTRERFYPQKKAGTFEIIQFAPEVEIKVTTPFRQKLGLKPKYDWTPITKPQIDVTRPFSGTLVGIESPYLAETGKLTKVPYGLRTETDIERFVYTKGKYTPSRKLFEIKGKSEAITPEEITSLSKPEIYTWTGKQGIVTQVGEEKLYQSALSSEKYFGKVGKTTETFYTASKIKPILTIGGEEGIKISETLTRFKETTKPLYRASGKIRELKGTLTEISTRESPKIDLGEDFSPLGFKEQTKQVTKQVEKITLPIPKEVKIRKPKLEITKPITTLDFGIKTDLIESKYPTYVGGTAKSESLGSFTSQEIETIYPTQLPSRTDLSLTPTTEIKMNEINIDILKQFPRNIVKEISILKMQPKILTKEMIKEQVKEIEILKPKTMLKELLKTKQKQLTKQLAKQIVKQKVKQKTIPKEKMIEFPSYTLKQEKKTSKEKLNDLFEVYGKRFGKDIKLFETKTQTEAEKKLIGFLTGTLGRSGFVEKGGERISFEELNLGNMFRPAKREKTRVVQKAKFSLGTSQEKREIKLARKKLRFI